MSGAPSSADQPFTLRSAARFQEPQAGAVSSPVVATRRSTLVCLLLLAIFAAITLKDLLSAERIPAYRDLLAFFVPYKHFLSEHLRHGKVPLWNPWLYMGTPFLGNLQSGVFYPPSVLLLLPFPLGFNLFLFSHFMIALGGFWLLLRDRDLPLSAMAIGTLTFVLGGYLVSMLNVTNNLQASVWAPWVLLFWRRYVASRSFLYLQLAALTLAIQLLGGAPEVLLMTLGVLSVWTAYSTLPRWRDSVGLGVALATALLIVAGMTAFQILPTWEYIGQSSRTAALPLDEVTTWSLNPVSLVQLFLPHSTSLDAAAADDPRQLSLESLEPWIRSIYLGLIPLCLAIAGTVTGRERKLWSTLVLAAVILALGRHTSVLPFLYDMAPRVIGKFRYPEKFIFIAHLAACILVAEGTAAWLRGDRRAERAACAAAVTFVVIAEVLVRLRWSWPEEYLQLIAHLSGRFAPLPNYVPMAANLVFKAQRVPLILGAFLALFVLRRMLLLRPVLVAALLPAIVAVDLGSIHYDLNSSMVWSELADRRLVVDVPRLRASRQRLLLYQTISAPLPDATEQPINGLEPWMRLKIRSYSLEEALRRLWEVMYLNTPMVHGVGTLSGSDGIARSSDNVMRNMMSIVPRDRAVKLVRIFGAAYLAGTDPLDVSGLERIEGSPPFFAYRIASPLPPAYFASRLLVGKTDLDAFNLMISPDFRPGVDATVEELPRGWRAADDASLAGTISIKSWEDEHIGLEVSAERAAFLVLNDSFFPGWHASVDGQPTKIFRTNALVRGVPIEAGTHRIVFDYRPESFKLGVRISLATFVGLGILAGITVWRRPCSARGRLAADSRIVSA